MVLDCARDGAVWVLVLELVSMLIFATLVTVVVLPRHSSSRLHTRPSAHLGLIARRNTWLGSTHLDALLVTRHGGSRHGRVPSAYHGVLYWAVLRPSLLT